MVAGAGFSNTFRVSAETNVGTVRKHNEDTLVNRPDFGLWAVADGAGGHEAGEVASGMIADALNAMTTMLSPQEMLVELRTTISAVHAELLVQAAKKGPGAMIASTVVILLIRQGHFACMWAGDSRGYLLRDGVLEQITRDHSLVQELVDSGALAAADAESHPQANIITRAVGAAGDALELDKVTGKLLDGDRFLLCSDGLSKTLDTSILSGNMMARDAATIAPSLIEAALSANVRDNVTAVVVEVRTSGAI